MKRPKTLILSRSDDEHVTCLAAELERLGHPWARFDPGDFPADVTLTARLGEESDTAQLTLPDGEHIALEEVCSIWYRRPTPLRVSDNMLLAIQRTFIEREARAGLWGLLRSIEARWVNHPDAIRETAYKPRQLARARQFGLTIPRTLITNNPDDFKKFYAACQGQVIYKLLGFPSYEVEGGAVASTFSSLVPDERLKEAHRVKATAHLFQEYQQKVCDLRIVIIGETLFAIEIHPLSAATRIDFRRDYRALRYAVHQLPATIQQALLALTHQYHLLYGAIDMILTPEGQYMFLEINPVGQLGWLEAPTGLPLFHTLARFLAMET